MMRNLKEAAVSHGVDPERLVFARRCSKPRHLARHCHADLFLNTPVYGGAIFLEYTITRFFVAYIYGLVPISGAKFVGQQILVSTG